MNSIQAIHTKHSYETKHTNQFFLKVFHGDLVIFSIQLDAQLPNTSVS